MGRILLATDGSDAAIDAASHATALLGSGHDYTVLAVAAPAADLWAYRSASIGLDPIGPALAPEVIDAQVESARHEAEEDLDRTLAAIDVEAERRIVAGDPGRAIAQVAADGDFDLIVMGSHGRGLVQRVLVGSVSHWVLHNAATPVMVVRRPDER
jgi:nucleotide-binding universal stress UspA family protein